MSENPYKLTKKPVSLGTGITIFAANMIPAAGVIFGGWNLFILVLFYWVEMVIVGIANIPKIYIASRSDSEEESEDSPWKLMATFGLHYGCFSLLFLVALGGCVIGITADRRLMNHDYFQPDGTGLIGLAIGVGLIVLWQLVEIFTDRRIRERTAREQVNVPGYRLMHPILLTFVALPVLIFSRSLTVMIVVVALAKAYLELQKERGLSKTVMG